MSGGVDSSVAAALLAEQGYDVIGLSMQLYDQRAEPSAWGSCCSLDDLHDARKVAAAIGIPQRLRDLGVTPQQLPPFAEKAFAIKRLMGTNPRLPTQEDLLEILRQAY